jgi:hypothetical protein
MLLTSDFGCYRFFTTAERKLLSGGDLDKVSVL